MFDEPRTPSPSPPPTPPSPPSPPLSPPSASITRELRCMFCQNTIGDRGYFSPVYFSQNVDQLKALMSFVKENYIKLQREESAENLYPRIRKEALGLDGEYTAMEENSLRDFVNFCLRSTGLHDLTFPFLAHTWIYLHNLNEKNNIDPKKYLDESEKFKYRRMIVNLFREDRNKRIKPGDPLLDKLFSRFIEWVEIVPDSERTKVIGYIEESIINVNMTGRKRCMKVMERSLRAHFDRLRPLEKSRNIAFEGMECTCELLTNEKVSIHDLKRKEITGPTTELNLENLRLCSPEVPPEPEEPPPEPKKNVKNRKPSFCGCGKSSYIVRKISKK